MTVKGIEVAGIIYDNEDETARTTATAASQTATTASQTATEASQTATTASQTATTASQTATQADGKADANATAISELQNDVETLDSEVLKKSDLTDMISQGSTNPVTSGGVYNNLTNNYGYKNSNNKKSITVTRNGVNGGLVILGTVFGEIYFLCIGDQENRFYLQKIASGSGQEDAPTVKTSGSTCTVTKGLYSMFVLAVFGNLNVS